MQNLNLWLLNRQLTNISCEKIGDKKVVHKPKAEEEKD
jgi:hypothetical protein